MNLALKVSQDVKAIKDLLSAASVVYADIKAKYDTDLKSLAEMTRTGEPVWDKFVAHYVTKGGATFITEYFNMAIMGTEAGFTDPRSRIEMIEKTVQDMLGMHLVLSHLWRGQASADKGLW